MARCVERMIREYPVRKPLNPEDPTSGDKDESDPGSVDNDLVGKFTKRIIWCNEFQHCSSELSPFPQ